MTAKADRFAVTHSNGTARLFWERDSKRAQPQIDATIVMQRLTEGTTSNAHSHFMCSLIFNQIYYCHMKTTTLPLRQHTLRQRQHLFKFVSAFQPHFFSPFPSPPMPIVFFALPCLTVPGRVPGRGCGRGAPITVIFSHVAVEDGNGQSPLWPSSADCRMLIEINDVPCRSSTNRQ